jgi:hypothetical protein
VLLVQDAGANKCVIEIPIMKKAAFLLLVIVTFGTASCRSESPKVEMENEWVRVFREAQAPQSKTDMRDHLPTLAVYLSDGQEKLTEGDGKVRVIERKAGEVSYFDSGRYQRQNISDKSLQVVVVELKDAAGKSQPSAIDLDPVKLDPEHHLVLFENERVRVLHTILEPHLKSPLHFHPHYVVVYTTELHTTQTLPDGRNVDNPRKAGDIAWRDALQHVTENIGNNRGEEIQIEVK